MPSPMPLVEPVTSATLPERLTDLFGPQAEVRNGIQREFL